jgi:hypothetical protein
MKNLPVEYNNHTRLEKLILTQIFRPDLMIKSMKFYTSQSLGDLFLESISIDMDGLI